MTEASDNEPRPAPRFARRSRKDVYVRVRFTQAERLSIYQAASDHLASVSGFVRGVLLDYIAKNSKGRVS